MCSPSLIEGQSTNHNGCILGSALICGIIAFSSLFGPSFMPSLSAQQEYLKITSPNFSNGGNIDKKFTCDGLDVSPQLAWTNAPSGTKSFALLVDDPDAPVGNWNHWTMWNIPASSHSLPENVPKEAKLPDGSEQGLNDFKKAGYNGPCPPPGKPHRYYFKLFALNASLDLKSNASKRELEAGMKGHILAQAEWMGRYGR